MRGAASMSLRTASSMRSMRSPTIHGRWRKNRAPVRARRPPRSSASCTMPFRHCVRSSSSGSRNTPSRNENRDMSGFPEHFPHATREREIYQTWETSGVFRADSQSPRKPFFISMPPPNATGTLHLGHAVMLAIEDLMIRWRRMAGDEVLWVPGTDHAAIANESTVIKQFQKKGMRDPRRELGREGLLAEIVSYVAESRSTIRSQIRAMGSSCDWSRERYTMDPELNRVVNETFGKMFCDGLIYRGNRIVNWDVALRIT